MKPKYLVCAGFLIDNKTGYRYYVDTLQLMRLYGVSPRECILYPETPTEAIGWHHPHGLIELHPDHTGKYELPKGVVSYESS